MSKECCGNYESSFSERKSPQTLGISNCLHSINAYNQTPCDLENSQINSHNDLTPRYRVSSMRSLLGGKVYSKILDIGCGLGYTTSEIVDVFDGANVIGIDISEDAILYAGHLRFSRRSTAVSSKGLENISILISLANLNNFLCHDQGVCA